MAGVITSLPPVIQQPPGNNASNPAGLPGYNYVIALLGFVQTWTAKQTFPLGNISLYAADVIGLAPSSTIDTTNASNITSGTLAVERLPIPNEQHITAAGPVVVGNNTGLVRIDQTVGAPITVTLGLASNKIGPVLIADWKGDAGTNNITIALSGSDKFPGNSTTWTISSDAGSFFFRPISGAGYIL
jgi:hypothetical protein